MVSLVMGRRRGKEGVASTVVFFTIALLALSNTASSLRQHKSKTELRKRRAAEVDDENTYRQNKYKPELIDCDKLKPEVEEEADRGLAVKQVKARDRDADLDPNSPAGKIEFSIVSTHNKFRIDPKTGWLSTNTMFNRDEPEREKRVYVTVKASDMGRPPLEDVCTIEVNIKDINDNAPIFDRANYDVPVAQDTPVDHRILRLSATDVDEGPNQQITYTLSSEKFPTDIEFFRWDEKTGEVWLNKPLGGSKPVGQIFQLVATAEDRGIPPKRSQIDVTIEVTNSLKKEPKFMQGPGSELELSEGTQDYANPIASYTASSQIPENPVVFFELVNGRTEQTNKGATFRAVQDPDKENQVNIYLAKPLEYEKVSSYTLTLQVRNAPDLSAEAQLNIKVKDENNQSPVFTDIDSGAVLEHEPAGTEVMRVSALDGDGTYPNNRVTYRIDDKDPEMKELFHINPDTGVITTKKEFDREEREVYALTVIAEDGAPSSLLRNGRPNQTPNKFRIVIKDKNDNPPFFPQQHYTAEVPEDADIGSKVIEVIAEDLDTEASLTIYSIANGNLGLTFMIEPQTGFIKVNKPLDYENIREYTLTVTARDGSYSNDTTVHIKIQNRNDMKPEFLQKEYYAKLKEEYVPSYPILQVTALDPDIHDSTKPQNITYYLDPKGTEVSSHFTIDKDDGSLRIIEALDRDRPDGYPVWEMFVYARDSYAGDSGDSDISLENFVKVKIELEDVNDNAPFLDMPDGLQWPENANPGRVGELRAEDYDTDANGPPFKFSLDREAPKDLQKKFVVKVGAGGKYYLDTLVTFDREEQKQYSIPIRVEDNQGMAAVSYLKLVIGDKNDNPMANGASSIFVYNYEGRAPDTPIGRVYVEDPDDWDLPDKTFTLQSPTSFPDFTWDRGTGMITMKEGIDLEQAERQFFMQFKVEDPTFGQVGDQAVIANVTVTVAKIPEEAVVKSGSIRLNITAEEFVSRGAAGRTRMASLLRSYLNATVVDVFTVLPSNKGATCDVRFAAHGSPYYMPEKMEVTVARRKTDLERQLSASILMVHISECIHETTSKCKGSCYDSLDKEALNQPTLVATNTSSFVGVTARVKPNCGCRAPLGSSSRGDPCARQPCMNGGSCKRGGGLRGYTCTCIAEGPQFGPNCEILAASYRRGWAAYPGLVTCAQTSLSFLLTTSARDGLLLYQGPTPNTVVEGPKQGSVVRDFMALELQDGKLKYFLNLGDKTWLGSLDKDLSDNQEHSIFVKWSNESVHLEIDDGACGGDIKQCQLAAEAPQGKGADFLNSNGPLQVGGLYFSRDNLKELSRSLGINRQLMPVGQGFAGCMKNLSVTQGGVTTLYSLGNPADFQDEESFKEHCDMEFVGALSTLNMNLNFLIAILVVLAVILTAVIVMAMYRRRRNPDPLKEIDYDIRENIINYEDEGGGEGDQAGYDLSVLRMMAPMSNGDLGHHPEKMLPPPEAPDIQVDQELITFLTSNKERVDDDPDANPYDDLRHYAYEGDGNSGGSLSSLNSGTDDADLEFEYLHNFGPRFKKLADMYGRESDSDESEEGPDFDNPSFYPKPQQQQAATGPPGSESWC